MIAAKRQLPALQNRFCVFSGYDAGWIGDVLQEAADRAGVSLPFKEEIVRSVMTYLEEYYPLRAMPLDYLFERIRSMLAEVGLRPLAAHLRKKTPPVNIPLDDIAPKYPYPLFFYAGLKREIESLREKGFTSYVFSGKKECVLALRHKKRWGKRSQLMMNDLDNFIEAYSAASNEGTASLPDAPRRP